MFRSTNNFSSTSLKTSTFKKKYISTTRRADEHSDFNQAKRKSPVSCLQLGPVQQPVRGCPGDPALPAPLSSRVSLLQCSNFSINPYNCKKAAIFAHCSKAANCTATAIETPRCCTTRQTQSFSTEFPSIPPSSKSIPTLTHILLASRDRQLATQLRSHF